jgi:hypothetical protein
MIESFETLQRPWNIEGRRPAGAPDDRPHRLSHCREKLATPVVVDPDTAVEAP